MSTQLYFQKCVEIISTCDLLKDIYCEFLIPCYLAFWVHSDYSDTKEFDHAIIA